MERFFGFIGIFAFLGLLVLLSENRKKIDFKLVASGLVFQLILALLILGVPWLGLPGLGDSVFFYANEAIIKILSFTEFGSRFLFGSLVDETRFGFIIAFKVLPTIIFFSSLMALLYHLKILPYTVYFFSVIFSKLFKVSGAESLAASANIFVGQTEAPLIVKPFIKNMTRSELFCLMVGGMATVAGAVMAAYVGFLKDAIPSIGGHLLTASILSAPASFICAKILIPETKTPETSNGVPKQFLKSEYANFIEACAKGTTEGLKLAVNVGAMLLTFIALMAFFDFTLSSSAEFLLNFSAWGESLVHQSLYTDGKPMLTFTVIFSWIFYPFSLLLGLPFQDAWLAASLLAKKLILNEFVAYVELSKMTDVLNERSVIILSYALCGFANFSSIGIQVGGIGALAPDRARSLSQMGLKAVLGGTMAAYITACIAGILI
jgi:CNT family concentrative nucleoside transporter